MARELTAKQEAFVLAYIETGNASEAYRRAYDAVGMSDASIEKEARKLINHPRITPRLEQIARKAETKALLSLEEHMEELKRLREIALGLEQPAAAIKAEELRGKLRRFYVTQVESGGPNDFQKLSDEELDAEIAALAPELQQQFKGARKGTRH